VSTRSAAGALIPHDSVVSCADSSRWRQQSPGCGFLGGLPIAPGSLYELGEGVFARERSPWQDECTPTRAVQTGMFGRDIDARHAGPFPRDGQLFVGLGQAFRVNREMLPPQVCCILLAL